jgi:D-alanyl-D-alanine endopeptidase (penicillin-binding protein 7)
MARSTLIFAVIAILLVGMTGSVVWALVSRQPMAEGPTVNGISVDIGLEPGKAVTNDSQQFTARSALLWDTERQTILFEQNGFDRVPIASLTKLMTAMVALDYGLPWDEQTTIEPHEYVQGGRLLLHPGETLTVRDLFNASLIGSANNATLAYVRMLPVAKEEFILAMNRKAVALGLEQTHFVDVTGLDPDNISTAYEVARMAEHAFAHYPALRESTNAMEYTFVISGSGREHTIRNTNKLVSEQQLSVQGSKTGYLYEAAYCLVVQGSAPYEHRIAVVLGSPSEPEHFADIKRLLERPEL